MFHQWRIGVYLVGVKTKWRRRLLIFLCVLGGKMNFDDLNWKTRRYNSINAYAQSKLANVLFTKELARRLQGKMR